MAYLEETATQPDGAQEGHDLQDEHEVDAGHYEAVQSQAGRIAGRRWIQLGNAFSSAFHTSALSSDLR